MTTVLNVVKAVRDKRSGSARQIIYYTFEFTFYPTQNKYLYNPSCLFTRNPNLPLTIISYVLCCLRGRGCRLPKSWRLRKSEEARCYSPRYSLSKELIELATARINLAYCMILTMSPCILKSPLWNQVQIENRGQLH